MVIRIGNVKYCIENLKSLPRSLACAEPSKLPGGVSAVQGLGPGLRRFHHQTPFRALVYCDLDMRGVHESTSTEER
jgi:hypothetical protein